MKKNHEYGNILFKMYLGDKFRNKNINKLNVIITYNTVNW